MSQINIDEMLEKVSAVAEQVRASQSSSIGDKTNARAIEKISATISDNAESYAERSGYSVEELFTVADMLDTLSREIAPKTASVTWKSDEMTATVDILSGFSRLGMLTAEQETLFMDAKSVIGAKTGARVRTGEVATYADRPTRVLVYDGDVKLANLAGNTDQAPGNLASRLAKITDTDKASDSYKVLLAKAREVCETNQTVTVGSLTLMPYEPDQE